MSPDQIISNSEFHVYKRELYKVRAVRAAPRKRLPTSVAAHRLG